MEDVLKCDGTKTFGNGDPNSTSGYAVPGYYVWALNNKTPEECFERVVSSNHEGNAIAVATNNTENIERLTKTHPEMLPKIKEIWRSPLISSDPMVWRKDLPQDLKQKVLYFFVQYGRFGDLEKVAREREIIANVSDGWGPFLAYSDAQLLEIRQIEAKKEKDEAAVREVESNLAKLKEASATVGKGGY